MQSAGMVSSDEMNDGRMMLPDVLKGIAVLAMIQVHLMELFALPDIYISRLGVVSLFLGGPPAAPVFMAVMGYFLARSVAGTGTMVLRGLKLILWGLLLNAGLNMNLFYHIFAGSTALNPLEYLFGADILFLAGLSTILIALFRRAAGKRIVWWLVLMVVVASAGEYIPQPEYGNDLLTYVLSFIYLKTPWSYFPLLPWLAYPLAGYSFYLINQEADQRKLPYGNKITAGFVLLVPLGLSLRYATDITWDLEKYYHHDLLFFLWVLMFLVFWTAMFSLLTKIRLLNRVNGWLQWVGRNVTAFYVIQWLLIGNLATVFYKSLDSSGVLIWYIGITALTVLLVKLFRLAQLRHKERTSPRIS